MLRKDHGESNTPFICNHFANLHRALHTWKIAPTTITNVFLSVTYVKNRGCFCMFPASRQAFCTSLSALLDGWGVTGDKWSVVSCACADWWERSTLYSSCQVKFRDLIIFPIRRTIATDGTLLQIHIPHRAAPHIWHLLVHQQLIRVLVLK